MRAALERVGYQVLEALDGEHGLRVAQHLDFEVDLLLSNLQLPRMRGDLLAASLRATYPSLRVLYITGHTDMVELAETDAVLFKPFTPVELVQRVRDIVATDPGQVAMSGC